MIHRSLAALFVLLATGLAASEGILDLSGAWKFKKGDDKAWAGPDLDDKKWRSLQVGKKWFEQGQKDYKGFAWYRREVLVPAAWAQDPFLLKDAGLRLSLGRILDADECYFNGEKIGSTGRIVPSVRSSSELREYKVPIKLVRFGEANTLSVRVLGSHLGGGMHQGPYGLRRPDWSDFIQFKPGLGRGDGSFAKDKPMSLKAHFENASPMDLAGSVSCTVETDDARPLAGFSQELKLKKGGSAQALFKWKAPAPGVYRVSWSFQLPSGPQRFSHTMNLVSAPEAMPGPSTQEADFKEFWDRTREELAAVDPQFKVTKQDFPDIKTQDIYLVEMRSLGNVRVRGWYSRPKKEGSYPVILEMPGAGGEMNPQLWDGLDDFAFFSLNPRGHGNSTDDFKPNPQGFWFTGMEDKDSFSFRGAYMDCVRAVDFLMTREEIDKSRIVAEGISQGGGLSLAVAALDPRVALCVADVPGMANWASYQSVRKEGDAHWARWEEEHPGRTRADAYKNISYCDNVNLAPWIKAETWIISGLQDPRVPPRGVFEAYARIPGKKKLTIFPFGTHDAGGGAQWFRKYEDIRKHFKLPSHPSFEKVRAQKFGPS